MNELNLHKLKGCRVPQVELNHTLRSPPYKMNCPSPSQYVMNAVIIEPKSAQFGVDASIERCAEGLGLLVHSFGRLRFNPINLAVHRTLSPIEYNLSSNCTAFVPSLRYSRNLLMELKRYGVLARISRVDSFEESRLVISLWKCFQKLNVPGYQLRRMPDRLIRLIPQYRLTNPDLERPHSPFDLNCIVSTTHTISPIFQHPAWLLPFSSQPGSPFQFQTWLLPFSTQPGFCLSAHNPAPPSSSKPGSCLTAPNLAWISTRCPGCLLLLYTNNTIDTINLFCT